MNNTLFNRKKATRLKYLFIISLLLFLVSTGISINSVIQGDFFKGENESILLIELCKHTEISFCKQLVGLEDILNAYSSVGEDPNSKKLSIKGGLLIFLDVVFFLLVLCFSGFRTLSVNKQILTDYEYYLAHWISEIRDERKSFLSFIEGFEDRYSERELDLMRTIWDEPLAVYVPFL